MKIIKFFVIFINIILSCSIQIAAQQAIFNIPSADILDKGKVYVELDAAFKIKSEDALQKFSSFVPRVVVGTGGNVEVGLNITGNIQPGTDATTLVPTVKWRFYQNKKKDLALFAGNHFFIPVRNRSYKFGTYTYAAIAKTINKTRLTAGAYAFSKNVVAPRASRAGGQFGVEHNVNSKLTLAADWLTGRHSNGYFTPGIIYKPTDKVTTYFSYSIGNSEARRGNHFFLFEIGYTF